MKQIFIILILAMLTLLGSGCSRNQPSERTPIHLNPNMDDQPKFKAQTESPFFADGSAMRLPVRGTVARGQLHEDIAYYTGRDADSQLVETIPVPITMALMRRGRERFDIFCSPCHSRTGDGLGRVIGNGLSPPPSFAEQRLRDTADGHIFEVITNGVRNMPAYKYQIPVADRWAIVAYLRALQRSQNAEKADMPPEWKPAPEIQEPEQ